MAKNLGTSVLGLLDHDRADLRAAAAVVLGAIGKGDDAVARALSARLGDPDPEVRRVVLDGLANVGATNIAAQLVPLLHEGDSEVAVRAAALLASQGASAESALRKEVGQGNAAARRMMAQLLLRRGTQAAVDAVIEQLADPDFGEQALQILRAALDASHDAGHDKLAAIVDKLGGARADELGKQLQKEWARAQKGSAGAKPKKAKHRNGHGEAPAPAPSPAQAAAAAASAVANDALRDPAVAALVGELSLILRLVGYMARASSQAMLVGHTEADRPRPIRMAAIAALRRIVSGASDTRPEPSPDAKNARVAEVAPEPAAPTKASKKDKKADKAKDKKADKAKERAKDKKADQADDVAETSIEKALTALIACADGEDLAVAQAAVDTLRGARIPESLAKSFAALARSRNSAAQTLAMERMPAGGGASAVKALVDALAGDDPAARDAAARGLAKAPEAVLPLARALAACEVEAVARRLAAALRAHRGHVSQTAADELVAAARRHVDLHAKGNATADSILLERILLETLGDVAPASHIELVFDHARRLRRAGKPVEAYGALKPILRGPAELAGAMSDDQRFFLAVLGLEAAGDAILRAAHSDDPVLAQFGRLAHTGFPVAKKLAREKDVSDEAIYGLGFRLLESHDSADQDLGGELLQVIVDERPKSKLVRAARNKLKLSGLLDEA